LSGGALHELRPRSAVELYDAALHLCVHTRSELPALALLGAAPLLTSVVWGVWLASHGEPHRAMAAVVALSLVFRQLCQGAGGLAALRELEGKPLSPLAALREAARRTPSMILATLWITLSQAVVLPITAGFSMLFLSPQLCGPLLIAEGSAHGFNFGKVARARLQGRTGAAAALQLLHGLALLFLMANLHGLVMLGLLLGHSLLGLDLTFIDKFTSLSHPFYDLGLLGLALLLLDPVRCATSALVLADARVRHEGFDLLSALRRLRESTAARAALVLLLLGSSPRAHADTCPGAVKAPATPTVVIDERRDPVPALHDVAAELGLDQEEDIKDGLSRADRLPRAERAKLVPLLRRLEHRLGQGSDAEDEAASDELRLALAEANRVTVARTEAQTDPRLAAQQILAQDEFRAALPHAEAAAEPEPKETPTWWTRFWKWVARQLRKLAERKGDDPADHKGVAITGGIAQWVTWVLVGLAAVVLIILVVQLLLRRKPAELAPGAGGGAGAPGEGEALDALAKPASVWGGEADALAAQGRFREAMRALYLALLATLHRRGAIDYHPTLSNWDYCDHFRGETSELAPFRELTLRFDFGWYGRLGADREGYGHFRALCAPLLQSAAPPGPARA
jgi:hypothetical protein